tara:strand:+ start:8837 stop:9004 length:168 start_codon:yes stop_codon:yes gene_type:complete
MAKMKEDCGGAGKRSIIYGKAAYDRPMSGQLAVLPLQLQLHSATSVDPLGPAPAV